MKNKTTIDGEIEHVLTAMSSLDPASEEYGTVARNLKEVCEARSKRASHFIDWNLIVASGVGILQVWMIMNHEQLHVIATKAIGFVVKGRI